MRYVSTAKRGNSVKKRECYKHLSDTNVVKFREQVDNDGNRHYFSSDGGGY